MAEPEQPLEDDWAAPIPKKDKKKGKKSKGKQADSALEPEAVVEALENSRPEKQYFKALVRLARAPTILYGQPDNFACTLRRGLIQVIQLYRYVHHC